ncbi:hypothetical protein C0Q70_06595 [Pomacea canaliculata]|uniref:Uncharacterized protein n=1 Tax=Pomacea canaliculata TaxID=400727 RepID=A0A2T7PCN1_POMCA|nr:hypothetical protein C0Q70_06595 [Pomacea canaliculata]
MTEGVSDDSEHSDTRVKYDTDTAVKYNTDTGVKYDTGVRSATDTGVKYDTAVRSATDTGVRYDTDTAVKYATDTGVKYDTDTAVKYATDTGVKFCRHPASSGEGRQPPCPTPTAWLQPVPHTAHRGRYLPGVGRQWRNNYAKLSTAAPLQKLAEVCVELTDYRLQTTPVAERHALGDVCFAHQLL